MIWTQIRSDNPNYKIDIDWLDVQYNLDRQLEFRFDKYNLWERSC